MTAPDKIWVMPAFSDKMGSEPMQICGPDFAYAAVEYTRSDLTPVVKPLDWKEGNLDSNSKKGDTHYARSMVDVSPIAIHRHPQGWWLNKDSKIYPTIEQAQAAAQADYESRILSALTTDPAALAARDKAVRDQALEDVLTKLTAIQTTTLPSDSDIHAESAYVSGQDRMFMMAVMTIKAMKGGA